MRLLQASAQCVPLNNRHMHFVQFHMQLADVLERGDALRELLLGIPGVQSVGPIETPDSTVDRHVRVAYEPSLTSPVLIEDTLRRRGFTIMSAAEQ